MSSRVGLNTVRFIVCVECVSRGDDGDIMMMWYKYLISGLKYVEMLAEYYSKLESINGYNLMGVIGIWISGGTTNRTGTKI